MSAQPFNHPVPQDGVAPRPDAERTPQRISMLVRAGRPAPQLIMAHTPDDPRAEELRALRTELLLRRAPEDDRADVSRGKEAVHELAEDWRYGGSLIPDESPRREAFLARHPPLMQSGSGPSVRRW